MIKEIVKDVEFLKPKSEDFNLKTDKDLIQDLLDTANHHAPNCVGLAAPQIGVHKRAIVVLMSTGFRPMLNQLYSGRTQKANTTPLKGALVSMEKEKRNVFAE